LASRPLFRHKAIQLTGGRGYGSSVPPSRRDVAEEIELLLEVASHPASRFDPTVLGGLVALGQGLRSGAGAAVLGPTLRQLDEACHKQGHKMKRRSELISPQLKDRVFPAYVKLQSDGSDWSKSWCKAMVPGSADAGPVKPCTQRTCRRAFISTLCIGLIAVGLHFIELRRSRYCRTALLWILESVGELDLDIDLRGLPEPDSAEVNGSELVLLTAIQGPLIGLLSRCPCAGLQHASLGTLLKMRDSLAIERAEHAFEAAPHARFEAIYRHMLLGTHPRPKPESAPFQGADDYPLDAAEYGKIVGKRPGAVTRALHDTIEHIRLHL